MDYLIIREEVMRLKAFAKINWSLDVTGVWADGYHLMDMVMQSVSLADEIVLTSADTLTVTAGGWPPVPADRSNLAYRAAAALKTAKRNCSLSTACEQLNVNRIPPGRIISMALALIRW